jgi:hypothetical protein
MPQFASYGTEPQTSAITHAQKRSRPYRASGLVHWAESRRRVLLHIVPFHAAHDGIGSRATLIASIHGSIRIEYSLTRFQLAVQSHLRD